MRQSKMKKLTVFLGSADTQNQAILQAIDALALLLAKHQTTLIYGGCCLGLMGRLADAALNAGVEVIGVIPESFLYRESPHPHLTQLIKVETLGQRIQVMQDMGDGFMIFPGGLGTLEELFSTWNQVRLAIIDKPMGLLNIGQYYTPLQQYLVQTIQKEGFVNAIAVSTPYITDDVTTLYNMMCNK